MVATVTEFHNEPMTDFSIPANREGMENALRQVEADFGREYPLVIGGKRVKTSASFKSFNPSNPEQVIGVFAKAGEGEAEDAIKTAHQAFQSWKWMPVQERATVLLRAASMIRQRRWYFNALLVLEVGKSWAEADGDTAEAIDFCEFYAREMMRLAAPQPVVAYPGEIGQYKYTPMGVALVIPPWNFALAIMVGMTTAAIVAGNTVVLKPSSDSPLIGYAFTELMEQAGLPAGVLNLITGPGGLAGEYAVKHPLTRLISFTGSREVGLRINQAAATVAPGQRWIKRVVAEMGGKDYIIIDDPCDLDAAATNVVAAAFGFQGQKCSAASRVIVLDSIYDRFIGKIIPKVKALKVGDVRVPANTVGPVINERAMESILGYIEKGRSEGRLLAGGNRVGDKGWFIEPTVFGDVDAKATIAQEEIFGPVLAITKATSFEQAVEFANGTEYGLTGAFYSLNREHIRQAKRQLFTGNLYINRKCTGALVGVHPFGGFNMSGTDSKAGGRDYLLLFTQAKSIAEKVDY